MRETFNFPPTPDPAAINVPDVLFACNNKCFDTSARTGIAAAAAASSQHVPIGSLRATSG